MRIQKLVLTIFLLSLGLNAALALRHADWLTVPALLAGWYLADMLSGLVHMYMDYRPCTPGKRLADLFFYEGSRESEEYLGMLRLSLIHISEPTRH